MRYPYLVTSDQHCHAWSQFSHINEAGVNNRLQIILDELKRAHDVLAAAGGKHSFYGGDLFHVRGNVQPSVFNPTVNTIREIHGSWIDLQSFALAGNHDLEGRNSNDLGNAMQQLGLIEGFNVVIGEVLAGDVLVISWVQELDELRAVLAKWAKNERAAKLDVIIHAPVNEILKGLPDHGLSPEELAAYGFRRVFAGHYHDHKVMLGGKVISIGATTHQTWSDPNTNAGFLLVYEDRVEFHKSQAPSFVDIEGADYESMEDLVAHVAGNYVRVKLENVTEAEIKEWRDGLEESGAVGVNIVATKKRPEAERGVVTKGASKTLEASVAEFVTKSVEGPEAAEVQKLCADFIAKARMAEA